MDRNTAHDVVVIGAGAAGLSAGLVLARAQVDVLLVDAGEQRNAPAQEMHGFVTRDGMPPAEFLRAAREELSRYGAAFAPTGVTDVESRLDGFAVSLADGSVGQARALLVATGLVDDIPDTPGVRERWGTLVHHCPYCHGYEVRDTRIVVIGGTAGEHSLRQAGLLRRYSDRVALVSNGLEPTRDERRGLESLGVHIVDGVVSHLAGAPGVLDAVALTDGTIIDADAVFVAPPQRPRDGILRGLGCELDPATGLVAVDAVGRTSVPGVWAAGNVVTPGAQVVTAAGAGSAAAIAISNRLLQLDLDAAAAA